MLARLQRLGPEVVAEVDHSGSLLRISPKAMAGRAEGILRELHLRFERLEGARAEQSLASTKEWFSLSKVNVLALEAYRTLARRWSSRVAREQQLSDVQRRRLEQALDEGFAAAVGRIPPERYADNSAWRNAEGETFDKVLADADRYLNRGQRQALGEVLGKFRSNVEH